MVKKVILIFCFLGVYGCFTKIHHKEYLIKYNSVKDQKLPLSINGFYYTTYEWKGVKRIKVFILYENGFLVNAGDYDGVSNYFCSDKKFINDNSYDKAMENFKFCLDFLKNSNNLKKLKSCGFDEKGIYNKGLYKIDSKGEIKIQYYNLEREKEDKDSFNSYFLYELSGKILNKNEFKITKQKNYRKNKIDNKEIHFYFIPNNNKPEIKNYWIKNK
ncbi:hypothetical protein [Tenacibaculum maritimum]|uniref:hypothetical protein n=1 Tax=Tenacibaculum maritimum TaxID=107401 RepID=UPI0012E54604|nr:hypothetical protein [Tenacibaculum maritimum]CAA0207532.1 conserved hypothetical protein [Tenacibaculum maritimum]